MDESVCLCDFAGSYKDCGFWYDYFPKYKAVKFGGLLSDIPNMPVDHEPTEEECETWIKDHYEFDYRPLDKLTVEIILEDCYPLNGVGESNTLEFQKKVTEQLQKELKKNLKKRILKCVKGKDYVYIDDIAIDLLIPKQNKETFFDKAYKELISDGKLILSGNCVREKRNETAEKIQS